MVVFMSLNKACLLFLAVSCLLCLLGRFVDDGAVYIHSLTATASLVVLVVGGMVVGLLEDMVKAAAGRPLILFNPLLSDRPSSNNMMQIRGRGEVGERRRVSMIRMAVSCCIGVDTSVCGVIFSRTIPLLRSQSICHSTVCLPAYFFAYVIQQSEASPTHLLTHSIIELMQCNRLHSLHRTPR